MAFSKTEIFFEQSFSPTVSQHKKRIVPFFFVIFIICTVFASQIGPLTEQEAFLPDDHWLQKAIIWVNEKFNVAADDSTCEIKFVWGPKRLDTSKTEFYDNTFLGTIVWDEDFDLSPVVNQEYLLQVCTLLTNHELSFAHRCFLEEFRDWRLAQGLSFPVDESADPLEQRAYFDASLLNFSNSGDGLTASQANEIMFEADGKLSFMWVQATTALALYAPRSEKIPQFNIWADLVDEVAAEAPVGLQTVYQTALLGWAWMPSEQAFVDNAIQGMGIASSFAFLALLVSTGDLLVAVIATFSIAGIVMSVMCAIFLMGWVMGVAESVALVILVGFSVDYVVHLGNSYIESAQHGHCNTREQRMTFALREMGVSVLAGAITTFGSSVFLWACISVFFVKFATLMALTVSMSLVWATWFFPSIMMLIGPEDDKFALSRCLCKKAQLIKNPEVELSPISPKSVKREGTRASVPAVLPNLPNEPTINEEQLTSHPHIQDIFKD